MATVRCKGSAIKQYISSAYVAVAAVISLDGPGVESETFEADTLDNTGAGIPYKSSGRTEGGSISGELFYDPALDSHMDLLELLRLPPTTSELWQLLFADTGSSVWTFSGAGINFSPTIALNDGLKASFGIKLDGIPVFPYLGSGSAA